jgi:hypothetical protein
MQVGGAAESSQFQRVKPQTILATIPGNPTLRPLTKIKSSKIFQQNVLFSIDGPQKLRLIRHFSITLADLLVANLTLTSDQSWFRVSEVLLISASWTR